MDLYQWFTDNMAPPLWVVVTFALGLVAGLQLLVARYPREYAMAIRTWPAFIYLLIRGSLPAGIFVALYKSHLLSLPPAGSAIVLGLGSEAFLRSRFLITFRSASPTQLPSEASAGPLDFITWLQDFFLDLTGKVLSERRRAKVNRWYRESDLPFDALCDALENDLPALGREDDKERKDAVAILASNRAEYEALKAALMPPARVSDEVERKSRLKLGYALYYALEKNSFHALSKGARQPSPVDRHALD